MILKTWVQNGWLVPHKTSAEEINDLIHIAGRDLKDCQTKGLSNDWRLNIAYNAGLQLAKAALAASGFRPTREAHHYRVIHSLAFTIKAEDDLVAEFDAFRKKRNISDYERAGMVSDIEVEAMIVLAKELRDEVLKWLKSNHPYLLK